MEIIIFGLRGGYKVLYNKSKYSDVAVDLRSSKSINDVQLLGQSAYSVSFSDGAYVLTKHIIIYDYRRGFSPLNFSIVIPNNYRLNGESAKSMLDKLEDTYSSLYLIDYYNKEENEDWKFIDDIKEEYQSKLSKIPNHKIDNFTKSKDSYAFLYYVSEKELLDYFSNPYQDEFEQYKFVYLINAQYEGSNMNPLIALKHNPTYNLSGKIDLNNTVYHLKKITNKRCNNVEIKIFANNKERNQINNRIKSKDLIRLEFSKPYYHSIIKEGSLMELKEKQLIIINEKDKSISVKHDVVLEPILKTIKLRIIDWKGDYVLDPIISIRNNAHEKPKKLKDTNIIVHAEDAQYPILIDVRENQLEASVEIIPENIKEEPFVIKLNEKKSVKFSIPNVSDNRVNLKYKGRRIKGNEITFNNNEIYAPCSIIISSEGYEPKTVEIIPNKEQANKVINLKRRRRYSVSAGEHGTLNKGRYFVYNKDGSDVLTNSIIPNKGYKHSGFKFENNKVIATYEKKTPFYKKPIFLSLSIALFAFAIGGVATFLYLNSFDENHYITDSGTKNKSNKGNQDLFENDPLAKEKRKDKQDDEENNNDKSKSATTKDQTNSEDKLGLESPIEDNTDLSKINNSQPQSTVNSNDNKINEETTSLKDTEYEEIKDTKGKDKNNSKTQWTTEFIQIVKNLDDKETKYDKLENLVSEIDDDNHEVVKFFSRYLENHPGKPGKETFLRIRDAELEEVEDLDQLERLIDKY